MLLRCVPGLRRLKQRSARQVGRLGMLWLPSWPAARDPAKEDVLGRKAWERKIGSMDQDKRVRGMSQASTKQLVGT